MVQVVRMMKEKALYSLPIWALISILVFSSTIVTGNDEDETAIVLPEEISTVDPEEVPEPMNLNDGIGVDDDHLDAPRFVGASAIDAGSNEIDTLMQPVNAKTFIAKGNSMTRASDEEKETGPSDFGNGSVFLEPNDSVTGTLTFDPVDTENMDFRDWFKLNAEDVDPRALASDGTILAEFTLNSYTSTSQMYEYAYDETYHLNENYADFLRILVFYMDIAGGFKYIGGTGMNYDDNDDDDGWMHDDNWSFDFETPIPSYTEEDTDGFANGLNEWGWYYIGLSFDFWSDLNAPERNGFVIDYDFTFNTASRNDTDEAGNDWWNATALLPTGEKKINSRYEQIDWYLLEGSDPAKHWNTTFVVNRTYGFANFTQDRLLDTFVHVLFIYYWEGQDDEWNTDDDGWMLGPQRTISYGMTGGIYSNYSVGWYLELPLSENPHREVYVGIYVEPMHIEGEGQDFTFRDPYFATFAHYTIWHQIVEETPNNPPEVSDLLIESDYDQSEVGGNYNNRFNFSVVYTDFDNDPPDDLLLFIDPDTQDQIELNMLDGEVDAGDVDYSDGKEFRMSLMGDDIGESGTPHVVKVFATDKMGNNSLRTSRPTPDLYDNLSLLVWNDNPVYLFDQWNGIDPISEDDPSVFIYLNYLDDGPFADPENDFTGFSIKNASTGEWDDSYDDDLLHIDVLDGGLGSWYLAVTPKLDQSGEVEITLQAEDGHSAVELVTTLEISPVNDAPVIRHVEIDGRDIPVEIRSGKYYMDISEDVLTLEDREYIFNVIADDVANEGSTLTYMLDESLSDDWKGSLNVDQRRGEIRLVTTNDDIISKNDKIVVTVDDGDDGGKVYLEILLDLQNVNDEPTIELPSDILLVYSQYDEIVLRPTFTDIDPNEVFTLDVNMDKDIEEYDAVEDILSDADLVKGDDWTFNTASGELKFKLNQQDIWKSGDEMVDQVVITLAFMVTDSGGDSDVVTVELTLVDINEAPPVPDFTYHVPDEDPDDLGIQGLTATFTAVEVIDPDMDELTYRWDFGDGNIGTGVEVEHTYATEGKKTVTLYADDGELESDVDTDVIQLYAVIPPEESEPESNEFNIFWVIIPALLIVLIGGAIAVYFMLVRKPQEGEADQDDDGSMDDHRHSCPHCGSSVNNDWFICPECKKEL